MSVSLCPLKRSKHHTLAPEILFLKISKFYLIKKLGIRMLVLSPTLSNIDFVAARRGDREGVHEVVLEYKILEVLLTGLVFWEFCPRG